MSVLLVFVGVFELVPGISIAHLLYMALAFLNGGDGIALTAILGAIVLVTPAFFSCFVAAADEPEPDGLESTETTPEAPSMEASSTEQ